MAESSSERKRRVICYGKKPVHEYVGELLTNYESLDQYVAFYEIPYAKVPEGLERYKAPKPLTQPEPAESVEGSPILPSMSCRLADKKGKICTQFDAPYFEGSSDCLYLNIYLPTNPELIKELLPVLVFIHGGGFSRGCNDPTNISPEFIVRQGLVFVTMNYRLGLFGFLNTHTPDCPGNAGLKDQVRALEWIRDNIEGFKGDPNNVTLSGSSAGATCVNLHLIVPASKDLFHKAIVQAGGVYSCWGYRGHQREQGRVLLEDQFCRHLFYATEETKALQRCACRLLVTDRKTRHPESLTPYFGPSVEDFREEAFIPEDIGKMMRKVEHNKPIMAGIAKDEGIAVFFINFQDPQRFTSLINQDTKFCKLLMDNFRWSSQTAEQLMETIRKKYFPGRLGLSEQTKRRYFANFARDIFFRRFYDNFRFGPQGAVHPNLYVYRFDHYSELSKVSRLSADPFHDATHEDEIKYLYCPVSLKHKYRKYIFNGPKQNKEILDVINNLCSLWGNFCRTGGVYYTAFLHTRWLLGSTSENIPTSSFAPGLEWKRHTDEEPYYLSIGKELVLKNDSLFREEWEWWSEIMKNHPSEKSADASPDE